MIQLTDPKEPAARKPLISVCIATFNQQDFIRDAVMSVLAQADPRQFSLEVLVGDDGSADATPEILRELAVRFTEYITIITHSPNVGAGKNYQALTARARGDFVAHLDGDDCWLPGKLAVQLAYLTIHPECVAVYSNALVTDAEGRLTGRFTNDDPRPFGADELLAKGNFLNHSSLLYRASSAQRVLDLPTPFIDYSIHLGLARDGLLAQLSGCWVLYRAGTATSMLRTMPEHVRDLYFGAMMEALPRMDGRTRAQASARYLSLSLVSKLAGAADKRLLTRATALQQASGIGPGRMAAAVAGRVALLMVTALCARVAAVLDRRGRLPVIHPRG
jgi:glycosyltransferase involved in cell wall biosynthesis